MNSSISSKVVDPVCGMTIDPAHAAATSSFAGETFHFCAASCKAAFDGSPVEYATAQARTTTSCCGGGHCSTAR